MGKGVKIRQNYIRETLHQKGCWIYICWCKGEGGGGGWKPADKEKMKILSISALKTD